MRDTRAEALCLKLPVRPGGGRPIGNLIADCAQHLVQFRAFLKLPADTRTGFWDNNRRAAAVASSRSKRSPRRYRPQAISGIGAAAGQYYARRHSATQARRRNCAGRNPRARNSSFDESISRPRTIAANVTSIATVACSTAGRFTVQVSALRISRERTCQGRWRQGTTPAPAPKSTEKSSFHTG